MPVVNRIADYAADMKVWRRHLHQHPELKFDCHQTAAFIVQRLLEFGVDEIHQGIAQSGVVAIINGQADGPTIGLRADMDALPIHETTGADWASAIAGRMHACGHDGHTTMLLGAARYLCETRRFSGRAALIFQPAEEDGGGGDVMVKEGVMDRFSIGQVYAIHNMPGSAPGSFHTAPGPMMAAVDTAYVTITGRGGHGGVPDACNDPIVAALAMVQSIQTIVSRNVPAVAQAVVSVTQFHAGTASNIIPEQATFCATIRSFDKGVQALIEQRFRAIVEGHAASFGVLADLVYEIGYPATVNDPDKTHFAAAVAREIAGEANVDANAKCEMLSEDFSYMLAARPGAYLNLGQGDGAGLHHSAYDFNDDIAPIGASFFARLVETAQPL